jgi:cation:H+ antiporter
MLEIHPVILFLVGLVLVVGGAEIVVRGGSRLAALLGIKPIIIGLTIVSLGTSAPELAVGITAALEGRGALAIGNIAGTNILNILFILGLSALLRPLPVQLLSIKLDVPAMIAAAVALFLMASNGVLGHFEGALLVLGGIVYTVVLVRVSRRERASVQREFSDQYGDVPPRRERFAAALRNAAFLIAGLVVIVWGAGLLVDGAVDIARMLGVSDAIIGLTIVAIGTSAPELATTIVATIKGERDIAVGNLVGSSSYNILFILGATCLASPGGIEVSRDILIFDLPLAAAVAVVCLPVFTTNQLISRREGGFFVASYVAYFIWLIMRA